MILALSTPDHTTTAWLFADAQTNQPVGILEWESGRSLSEQLLARLTQFLSDHAASLSGLTGIVIFSGPGSFTSLRIGHTTANALADSLGIPVVGATGPNWLAQGRKKLTHTPPGHPALPVYGADAHITKPKS